ncbi:SAV_915 family protein [Streptomyces sp. NPDC058655]|uniref:SAV_915 family protein n=1 Tax=unclassified Streptomyces TaxID=2593676 RepID=UPI00364EF47E
MCLFRYDDDPDPDPEERTPAAPLYVPVRPGPARVVVRLFRTALGARTAVGFTSAERLAATLGADQAWIRLSASALRGLSEPLGATSLTVDPTLTAPAPAGTAVPAVTALPAVTAVPVASAGPSPGPAVPAVPAAPSPGPAPGGVVRAPRTTARTA